MGIHPGSTMNGLGVRSSQLRESALVTKSRNSSLNRLERTRAGVLSSFFDTRHGWVKAKAERLLGLTPWQIGYAL